MKRVLCAAAAFLSLSVVAYAQSAGNPTASGPQLAKAGILTDETNFDLDEAMIVRAGLCTPEQWGLHMLSGVFNEALGLSGALARSTRIRLSWVYTTVTYDNKGHPTRHTKAALVLQMPKRGLLAIDPSFANSLPSPIPLGQYCFSDLYSYWSPATLVTIWRVLRANGATLSYDPRFVPLALPGAVAIK